MTTGLALMRGMLLGGVLAGSACSVIYDGDGFQYKDATPPDAMIDAFVAPDVDVGALELASLEPPQIFEGEGCVPDGEGGCDPASRAVAILVRGDSIAPDAVITLDGGGFDQVVVPATISASGLLAAFEVSIPVMATLPDGDTAIITVTVSQADVSKSLDLTVRGLDELIATRDAPAGTLGVLRPRYSSVHFDAPVIFTGTEPARVIATAEIVVDAALSVRGAHAGEGGAGGPGGCSGGAAIAPGTCEAGGGQGGDHSGGGGGGHGTTGTSGGGANGGTGGGPSGTAELVPLGGVGLTAARGHGGGGGGKGALSDNASGGPGGGGGGVLELTSSGALRFTENGSVDAIGGTGGPGTGLTCSLGAHGGGGGGGSGGAVLLRGRVIVEDSGTGARVDLAGGDGGVDTAGGCIGGGKGSVGRVRLDSPHDADVPAVVSGLGTLHRGPALAPATPAIVTDAQLALDVLGGSSQTYHVRVGAGAPAEVTTLVNRGTLNVTLTEGSNQVCALARVDVGSAPEGVNCFAVVYIPSL
ncbi:MAG TPA: hypothetical protein VML75_22780 [Kofleriaceae bacterium]|nr:hypothetical protein [Kofleriaceae bacterium]